MELPLLQDIVIILGLSVLIILLFQKLRLPSILGFLITGILAGPHGLNLIKAVHEVELISEIGIIFLLFVIGIEFSLKGLTSIRKTVLTGGLLQVGATIALVALFSYLIGLSIQSALFMGFLLSMSSTAIVLKMLQEKGELTAPHGRVSVAILIFQDIFVVLLILVTPLLAGQFDDIGSTVLLLIAKVSAIVVAVVLLARYIVPLLLGLVVKTQSRELFILTIIVLCFATAWLTSTAGLSLALGAFFAGLIISESEYSHQATANILPFHEIFISFFFVSVGMLLDFSFFIDNLGFILLMALCVILLKLVIIGLTVLILRYSLRTVLLTALGLFQVGEFAFLLSAMGMDYNLLSADTYQYFLSISIISMGITPFVIELAPSLANSVLLSPIPEPVRSRFKAISRRKEETLKKKEAQFHDHLVVIGYGVSGENVVRAARKAQIPYVIIETDPEVIQKAKKNGDPAVFGDATNEVILKHVHVQEARVIVIAISSPEATRQIVRMIRVFTDTAYIIVRTHYVKEVDQVIKLGADQVIPEEFETSIEIFTRVLKMYLVPNDEIHAFVNEVRSHNYEMFRSLPAVEDTSGAPPIHIPEMEIATLSVQQGWNKIVGKTIGNAQIRAKYGVTILAIKRGDQYISDITPEVVICQDDILYIFGRPDDIVRINKYFTLN